jgi:hypothetical protein
VRTALCLQSRLTPARRIDRTAFEGRSIAIQTGFGRAFKRSLQNGRQIPRSGIIGQLDFRKGQLRLPACNRKTGMSRD